MQSSTQVVLLGEPNSGKTTFIREYLNHMGLRTDYLEEPSSIRRYYSNVISAYLNWCSADKKICPTPIVRISMATKNLVALIDKDIQFHIGKSKHSITGCMIYYMPVYMPVVSYNYLMYQLLVQLYNCDAVDYFNPSARENLKICDIPLRDCIVLLKGIINKHMPLFYRYIHTGYNITTIKILRDVDTYADYQLTHDIGATRNIYIYISRGDAYPSYNLASILESLCTVTSPDATTGTDVGYVGYKRVEFVCLDNNGDLAEYITAVRKCLTNLNLPYNCNTRQ